jgi:hypothetical protein
VTLDKDINEVFDFFENIKNMEIEGAIKSVTKGDDRAGKRSNALLQESLR